MSHTPGPWERFDYRVLAMTGEHVRASVCWTATNNKARTAEAIANAILIAAAPDLLAALKESTHDTSCHPSEGRHSERCLRARAAIAKAEGRGVSRGPADETL